MCCFQNILCLKLKNFAIFYPKYFENNKFCPPPKKKKKKKKIFSELQLCSKKLPKNFGSHMLNGSTPYRSRILYYPPLSNSNHLNPSKKFFLLGENDLRKPRPSEIFFLFKFERSNKADEGWKRASSPPRELTCNIRAIDIKCKKNIYLTGVIVEYVFVYKNW